PFSWPNNSDSTKVSVRAAQLTLQRGPSLRGLPSWTACADNSLPEPVSPRISTLVVVPATREISLRSASIAGLAPIILERVGMRGATMTSSREVCGPGLQVHSTLQMAASLLLH